MSTKYQIDLSPELANDDAAIKLAACKKAGLPVQAVDRIEIHRRSIDARKRKIKIVFSVSLVLKTDEPKKEYFLKLKNVNQQSKTVLIAGAGPAGLFAALKLLEHGIKPILIDRGKDVKSRRRDLALLNKQGIVNPESNYCFGQGGAGTYSDGKLYTRSTKRGDVLRILNIFRQYGAADHILYDAHPHIGTNKLPQIIDAISQAIINHGGEIHYNSKLTDLKITGNHIDHIITNESVHIKADAYILACGHSARDIFELLVTKNIHVEPKPIAVGVRIEHPQNLINTIQYGEEANELMEMATDKTYLPPASYALVQQINGAGVFSFCMCPGGIIAPAATEGGEVVVNGWSPSKRNNPFANSGMVVEIKREDVLQYMPQLSPTDPLLFMKFQQKVEQNAFAAAHHSIKAPAQRLIDFINGVPSVDLPAHSYLPGLTPANLENVLPGFIYSALRQAFVVFDKKLKGFLTNEAIVVATESRTSSPVRIPRLDGTCKHTQIQNLYPCGEGAGYAGGIMSAAIDGEIVADAIAATCMNQEAPNRL